MGVKKTIQYILGLVVLAGLVILTLPLVGQAANMLQNDGLEPPFDKYGEWTGGGNTFDLEVAHDWERFFISAGTADNGDKLRYFRASAVEFLFGFTEKREGTDAQLYWSTEPFDAGIYQQVSGLTIGEVYGFQAGILQVYANTTSKTHNKMFRSVGVDPYGGTDPTAPNVIWGPEEGLDVDWFYPGVGTQALSTTMTVFVRVRSIDDAPQFEENSVWVDDTFFDVAPTTTLTLTVDSPTQVTATWSGAPRSGFNLYAYEAQYRKVGGSAWSDLQLFDSAANPSTNSSQSFAAESGQQYEVRARTWHEQSSGDSHEVPGPWAEATVTAGGLVSGRVLDNQGNGLSGATVSVSGSPGTNTTSQSEGNYNLLTGAGTFDLTATNGSGWTIPHPVSVSVPNLETVAPLTITLRPPDDVIANGDFENDLLNWQVSGTTPTTSTGQFRTASRSLRLADNVTISQTDFISGGYRPMLAFWYRLANGDGDDTFTAELLGNGLSTTNSFNTSTIGGWKFATLPLSLTETYTGPIGVRFNLSQSASPSQTVVYLDEVSLGSARQLSAVYLPLILK